MNINPINNTQQTNFKGYLKLQGGRYIDTKNITSVLYDFTDIFFESQPKTYSASFMMSDGLQYALQYLTKPVKPLIENIMEANRNINNVVNIDALLFIGEKKTLPKLLRMQNQTTLESFKKYLQQKNV